MSGHGMCSGWRWLLPRRRAVEAAVLRVRDGWMYRRRFCRPPQLFLCIAHRTIVILSIATMRGGHAALLRCGGRKRLRGPLSC